MLIYLASPYTGNEIENYTAALDVTAKLLKAGLTVYSPIVYGHILALQRNLPTGFEFWEKLDFAVLDKSDVLAVLRLKGWKQSIGVQGEIKRWEDPLKWLNRSPFRRYPHFIENNEKSINEFIQSAQQIEIGV